MELDEQAVSKNTFRARNNWLLLAQNQVLSLVIIRESVAL